MYILAVLLIISLSGCVEGKPITPTEVQVAAQLISKRLILPKVTPAQRDQLVLGLRSARASLASTSPIEVMEKLPAFLGPENKDISDFIVVMVQERVDLRLLTEMEGKAYVFAVLAGVEGGLQ